MFIFDNGYFFLRFINIVVWLVIVVRDMFIEEFLMLCFNIGVINVVVIVYSVYVDVGCRFMFRMLFLGCWVVMFFNLRFFFVFFRKFILFVMVVVIIVRMVMIMQVNWLFWGVFCFFGFGISKIMRKNFSIIEVVIQCGCICVYYRRILVVIMQYIFRVIFFIFFLFIKNKKIFFVIVVRSVSKSNVFRVFGSLLRV